MNQPLFQQFAEIVKAGKCDAFFYRHFDGESHTDEWIESRTTGGVLASRTGSDSDWGCLDEVVPLLCHHIREWLTGQGCHWTLSSVGDLIVCRFHEGKGGDTETYGEGTQLDWHLNAVVDICAGKVTP